MTTLMVSDPYVDIFAFQNHSNRGAPSVLDETNETSSGTKWDYATQWSFHPGNYFICTPIPLWFTKL